MRLTHSPASAGDLPLVRRPAAAHLTLVADPAAAEHLTLAERPMSAHPMLVADHVAAHLILAAGHAACTSRCRMADRASVPDERLRLRARISRIRVDFLSLDFPALRGRLSAARRWRVRPALASAHPADRCSSGARCAA